MQQSICVKFIPAIDLAKQEGIATSTGVRFVKSSGVAPSGSDLEAMNVAGAASIHAMDKDVRQSGVRGGVSGSFGMTIDSQNAAVPASIHAMDKEVRQSRVWGGVSGCDGMNIDSHQGCTVRSGDQGQWGTCGKVHTHEWGIGRGQGVSEQTGSMKRRSLEGSEQQQAAGYPATGQQYRCRGEQKPKGSSTKRLRSPGS